MKAALTIVNRSCAAVSLILAYGAVGALTIDRISLALGALLIFGGLLLFGIFGAAGGLWKND